jgi:hypothetical protein
MNRATIRSEELAKYTVTKEQLSDEGLRFVLREKEDGQELLAVLPAWCDESTALDVATLILAHENRGLERGQRIGAKAEREKIAYGFNIAFGPLATALINAVEAKTGTS